jgi:hypothetical protein
MWQNYMEFKREVYKFRIRCEDIASLWQQLIDGAGKRQAGIWIIFRTFKQSVPINQMHQPTTAEHIFFSSSHEKFSRIDSVLDIKLTFTKLNEH